MSKEYSFVSPGAHEVVFYDDFAGSELDRTRWNVRITGHTVNNEQQAYVDSPETLYSLQGDAVEGVESGGVLVLHPRYRPGFVTPEGRSFDFISARIDTRERFDFRYGTASARIRLPDGAGLWPAFWAMGNGPWPDIGEIDIMEYVGEKDWVSAALHGPGYSGESGLVNNYYFGPGDDVTAWHVYSVDWAEDQLSFHVDGNLVYRVSRPRVEFHGRWAFDNPKFLILNFAIGGIYPFKCNGIQQPYYGLPDETVEILRAGEAKVQVDWVRVEK